ncbi:hypothetical protein F4818DRAFT_455215 [Hypoxylon cercidicola]|nr:hypothetical protein F4818DRAFT_455215 [Hypoxylon cercidicola]
MDLLKSVFNHLVLPPQLPGGQDPDIETVSRDVLERMIRACETANTLLDSPWSEAFQSVRISLEACLALHSGRLEKSTMRDHFRGLQPNHMLILHIVEQNAAVLIHRGSCDNEQRVFFEAFETSAASEQVLAAGHAVQWDFPGRSAQLPLATFNEGPFQECLATFLEQASMELLYNLQASTRKKNVSLTEVRDTTDPALVTQMLMPLLEAVGSYFQAPVLRKRVRDDVNIQDANLPWRRLPFWLILRVASQRQFCLILGNQRGRIAYKFLVCLILAELLEESTGKLSPDLVTTLRTKLSRRMAKLEMDRTMAKPTHPDIYALLFNSLCPKIQNSIQQAITQIETAWDSFRHATTRYIPKLPFRAPALALELSLPNSGEQLDRLLSSRPRPPSSSTSFNLPQPLDKAIRQTQDFTDHVFRLAAMEMRIDQDGKPDLDGSHHYESRCVQLAQQIDEVFTEVGTTYDSDPEQMSIMILSLFTVWVQLDKCTIAACPLLADHQPVFNPELLDALQLPALSDMRRLRDIQTYLAQRQSRCRHGTIFDKIDKNCLAVRYVARSTRMQSLGERIQTASDRARDAKEAEWKRACEEYDRHTKEINGTCCCSWSNGQRDVRGCKKCWHWRVRKRMEIQAHEAFLPANNPAKDALIFELAIPSYLSAYRNATWRICHLAYPSRPTMSSAPMIKLAGCKPLQPYITAERQGISLASTIKCFSQTHYKFHYGKVPLSSVLLPLGANFELYDGASKSWIKDFGKPLTFEHLCGIYVPHGLRAAVLPTVQHPLPTVEGPTSYEVQANQTECPPHMSLHEFSAFQKLLGGQARRWPNIVVELGSSNLNLGNEETARVVCQLAVQAGPLLSSKVLRTAHAIFEEPNFVKRLADVIEKRLRAILTNWRERYSMELLITLSLRLFSLSSGASRELASALLRTARDATLDWTIHLRKELRTATDADAAQRIALYGFCAALLCRRTFAVYAETNQPMSAKDVSSWIQASVALQENLVVDLGKLPQNVKSMFLRDTKMAYHLHSLLETAIRTHSAGVGDGIARSWSDAPDGTSIPFSTWNFLSPPHNRWIVAQTSESGATSSAPQTIHCNIIEGHLLVNGKPRGKLPSEIRDSPAVKDMFGNQHLLTYPSSLPGMTHRLSNRVNGQDVHFGMRGEQVVIRAWNSKYRHLLEFIPKQIFTSSKSFDLPAELVDSCTHWLNLNTKQLEVRRAPEVWIKRLGDWEINIPERIASRKNVSLVDPQSEVFARVYKIFQDFEQPEKLTVYQPLNGKLSVELRHLELSFYVNNKNLLECRQLNMEIDPDQDPGTWYGLQSKIVLRDVISQDRSIIVPLGELKYKRHGMHVAVRIHGTNEYGKYGIDNILGRLSCPPEPLLLYTKSLCHAITSFCLADPLTGRTGTEEAFSILRSGAAQPWIPFGGATHAVLKTLEALPPRREYYPAQMRRFQRATWSENLTTTIQHDGFASVIRDIINKSNRLNEFANGTANSLPCGERTQLHCRGEMHRRLYERPMVDTADPTAPDVVYHPRDREASSKAANVYEVVRLILTGCPSLHLHTTLKSFLEATKIIGGFCDDRSPFTLINQIEDPIHENWGDLVQLCRHANLTTPLLFRLGLLAFSPNPEMDIIRSLAAFAVVDRLKILSPPPYNSFVDFKSRRRPSMDLLQTLIAPAYRAFVRSQHREGVWRDRAGRNAREHKDLCEKEGQKLAGHIREQWPISAAKLSTGTLEADVIDVSLAVDKIHPEWERRRTNTELEHYVNQVQEILDSLRGTQDASVVCQWANADPAFIGPERSRVIPSIAEDLLKKTAPPLGISLEVESEFAQYKTHSSPIKQVNTEAAELESILNKFASSATVVRRQYAGDLLQSLTALKHMDQPTVHGQAPTLEEIVYEVKNAHRKAMICLMTISSILASGDNRFKWLQLGTLWPCISSPEILAFLRSASGHHYGPGMKEALVKYGVAVTHLQRLERIRNALLRKDGRVFHEELQNPGHENWSPLQSPDWLLLEIDSNFLIRAEQVDVAQAMIAPSSGQNSVLQMNMGKGKTSCIVPMVVAALADSQNLVRLIVPKALLMQTAQTAQSRLGGLLGREVLHVPFSRKTRSTAEMLELYANLHQEARNRRGLILTSHEHVLSYKLGGWQHLAEGKLKPANSMTSFQHWLDDHCRDILDECDFTLAVKTQLNYPSGPEMAVDGHPYRWQVAQELLALVADYVPVLQKRFPGGIEVLERTGSFPIVHILNNNVENAVHNHILDNICTGRTTFLRPADSGFSRRQDVIRSVLSERNFDEHEFIQAANAFVNPQAASKMLLVARGLLINRILLLCLAKRWNVQYGLHPGRHPVAVPFEAKGKPSEQSEFGHPDVAILFTCLAFYYAGLDSKQFSQGLQNVLQSDDPAAQYEQWTSGCHSLPDALRHWNVVNVDDGGQIEELRQHLRLNHVVINHYLNHFVFPIHAKQFDIKLQASAWDLPLYSPKGQRGARTTGFSGTNDNRAMLPLTIRQDDLPSLKQTSAEVLSYLLQSRNRGYQVTTDSRGRRLSEIGLLKLLHDAKIRVLIDAGAYILEMDNATLAQAWLKIDWEAKAAVYFGNDNRAWVHYRGEKNDVPLLATPFADDLRECVVYLDEAHTRGVDLKLPRDAHGALTLALKQTKDFTMQGKYSAMRLRQLRTTQSVTFFAPPEVDQSIKDFCRPVAHKQLDSSHVITWLLEQTCHVNEDLQSLYVAQGLDFCLRTDAVWSYGNFLADTTHRAKLLNVLQQPEQQTLEQLYGGTLASSAAGPTDHLSSPQLQAFVDHLNSRSGERGALQIGALEEVEQEREVQVQVEQVRQVQKPLRFDALTFPALHPAISDFARTGVLGPTSSDRDRDAGFEQAFAYVARTGVGKQFGVRATDSRLFVSTEFGRTVVSKEGKQNAVDNFLRPVEWILWSPSTRTALIVIPEEAELLIPVLRLAADKSPVYLITYAAPVTKAMLSFNNFDYYSLPALPPGYEFPGWFRFELGLLSGRLYVHSAEWDSLACRLQLPPEVKTELVTGLESTDGVKPTTLADDPASFLLEWLTLLRKTQDILQTPMGYICTGRRPGENHPFLSLS